MGLQVRKLNRNNGREYRLIWRTERTKGINNKCQREEKLVTLTEYGTYGFDAMWSIELAKARVNQIRDSNELKRQS